MSTIDLLEERLKTLETRLHRLESVAAVERLQRMYGYYLDNRMWKETVALFTDDGEVEIGRRGDLPRTTTAAHVLLRRAGSRPSGRPATSCTTTSRSRAS